MKKLLALFLLLNSYREKFKRKLPQATAVARLLPASRTPKMRRNFRNRKIASVPVKGPAFSDPKGASRPSGEGEGAARERQDSPWGRGAEAPARLWFLSPRRERNRTAACGRGKGKTR